LCSVLLLIAERQSVTLGQIKRVEDALIDEPGERLSACRAAVKALIGRETR
jgi:hypothetical protein